MTAYSRLLEENEELRKKIAQLEEEKEQIRKDLKARLVRAENCRHPDVLHLQERVTRLEEDNAARLEDQRGAERDRDAALQKLAEEQDKNEHLVERVGDLKGDVLIQEKEIEGLRSEIARLEGLAEDRE